MEEFLIDTIEYKGYNIKIYQDPHPHNPREDENMGKMVCFHRDYSLGDKTDLTKDMFNSWEELKDHLIKEEKAIIIFPLYLYDHSIQRIKIGSFIGHAQHAEWDSGMVGFIYATAEDIKSNYQVKKIGKRILERAKKLLEGEVKDYDKYISGQMYGFVAEDKEGEHIDSCWGYYDIDEMTKEAEASIDSHIEQLLKKREAKLKAFIKNKVSLTKRELVTV